MSDWQGYGGILLRTELFGEKGWLLFRIIWLRYAPMRSRILIEDIQKVLKQHYNKLIKDNDEIATFILKEIIT